MRIIIPMAGMGKRMRPHTLTTPKPLIPVAGKPMVQRLVEDLISICPEEVTEIAFIISHGFGKKIESDLLDVAIESGAKGKIYFQDKALGIAHALLCAKNSLQGKIMIAFADTLFIPDKDVAVDMNKDGIIWVQKIQDPKDFGVVKLNEAGVITDFVEKPQNFISDLAIIGIYFFKEGEFLKKECQNLIDNNEKEKGEFQLTSVLQNMKKKGTKFITSQVKEWLDCGNKNATLQSNQRLLEVYYKDKIEEVKGSMKLGKIIPPCTIGANVEIVNSTIGPYVSIGDNCTIENSSIKNSIIQSDTKIVDASLCNSIIGNFVEFSGITSDASIGDYSVIKN